MPRGREEREVAGNKGREGKKDGGNWRVCLHCYNCKEDDLSPSTSYKKLVWTCKHTGLPIERSKLTTQTCNFFSDKARNVGESDKNIETQKSKRRGAGFYSGRSGRRTRPRHGSR